MANKPPELNQQQREKFHRLMVDAMSARHRVDALSAERGDLREKRDTALKIIDRAEKAADARAGTGTITEQEPEPHDLENARHVIKRWEMLEASYQQAGQQSAPKRALLERMAEFLIKKGVRDPMVLECIEELDLDLEAGTKGRDFLGQHRPTAW